MVTLIRLTTVHPALVHFTIGAVPIIFIAYAMGARRQDDRWTFVGDVATVVAAILTLGTLAFGAVSNWTLDWPGSLETFRWLHVALGIASTVLLCAFAVFRIVRRRRQRPAIGAGTVGFVGVTAAAVLLAGWIGGEVLVFRSGMAVAAAGDGALAQPTSGKPAHPRDVPEAMDAVQAGWGSASARMAGMIVREPDAKAFRDVETDAHELEQVARWMQTDGAKKVSTHADAFRDVSKDLEERAGELASAAHDRDVQHATAALGGVERACADCHSKVRWQPSAPAQASLP